ncbi:MAG: phosphatidylserine decarboxylase [Chloracidobacterium sp.]|nr:phosphatidylserine decarboxylase [Chloracidobacterium sp.]
MSMSLKEWLNTEVRPFRDKPISWISQYHFFRDPMRPTYSDTSCFFSPADGIILYQRRVAPDACILDIKGKAYSLRDAMRDPDYSAPSLVIGIFMTFFDVHVNRIPYSGLLSYKETDAIDTYNRPMLDVENSILQELRIPVDSLEYLHHNQRMINRIYSPELSQSYYLLQIADYDVDCITPFQLKQNQPVVQGRRFSQVRYGSQVDLIVPLSPMFEFTTTQNTGDHVEAGITPLIRVTEAPEHGKEISHDIT